MAMGTQDTVLEHYTTLMGFRANRQQPAALRQWETALHHTLYPLLPESRSSVILDAGCGDGALLRLLAKWGYANVSGFDVSSENVAACHADGFSQVERWNVLDIAAFQPVQAWDCVILWDVLEHLPKDKAVPLLADIRKRLTPSGCLLLQTPNMGALSAAFCRYTDVTHETGFTEYSLKTVLLAAGFGDIRILPAWRRATLAGRLREVALRIAHRIFWALYGKGGPCIASANLIGKARSLGK